MKTNIDITISTHTPLAGRDDNEQKLEIELLISTHTPLAGRDRWSCPTSRRRGFLPTRASREVTLSPVALEKSVTFLLTRPSRDVTVNAIVFGLTAPFLLTRPSRDVTRSSSLFSVRSPISTHTPLAGRDSDL